MIAPAIPDNEEPRRQSLERMTLLSTPDEAMFDRVTRTAQRLFGTAIASFTLVDRERQYFKSVIGLGDIRETPREVSFCGHVIFQDEMMVVPNAHEDERFADNPLVLGAPGIRFYAGRPIRNSEGFTIGTFCVIDQQPRAFSQGDRQSLDDLATWLESLLLTRELGEVQSELLAELDSSRREALIDPLLRIWNRRGIDDLLPREAARAKREGLPLTLAVIDLIGFTIMAGVAQARGADLDASAGILMQRADEALYVAKQRGRAQAAAWADAMEPVSSTSRRNHGGARPF